MKRLFVSLIFAISFGVTPVVTVGAAPLRSSAAPAIEGANTSPATQTPRVDIQATNQPLCPCNPCAPANGYHRNAKRINQYFAIRGQLIITGSGLDGQHCYYQYNLSIWATDGQTINTWPPRLQIRIWWPSGGQCGVNNLSVENSPSMNGQILSFTSQRYYYGTCGPQADDYNTYFQDANGDILSCAVIYYGHSCYVSEQYPSAFPNV